MVLDESLSPFSFSVFLNNIEEFLVANRLDRLEVIAIMFNREFNDYLKLFTILYSYDSILLAESTTAVLKTLCLLIRTTREIVCTQC